MESPHLTTRKLLISQAKATDAEGLAGHYHFILQWKNRKTTIMTGLGWQKRLISMPKDEKKLLGKSVATQLF